MDETPIEFALPGAAATERLGAAVARAYAAGPPEAAVLYLYGELGAGKTTLARSLLRSFGINGPIRSPTYTLLESYDCAGICCVHVDLYRLAGPVDVEELGLRDFLLGPSLMMVEWPERGGAALPVADLAVTLRYAGEARRARLASSSMRGVRLLSMLRLDTSLISYVSNLT